MPPKKRSQPLPWYKAMDPYRTGPTPWEIAMANVAQQSALAQLAAEYESKMSEMHAQHRKELKQEHIEGQIDELKRVQDQSKREYEVWRMIPDIPKTVEKMIRTRRSAAAEPLPSPTSPPPMVRYDPLNAPLKGKLYTAAAAKSLIAKATKEYGAEWIDAIVNAPLKAGETMEFPNEGAGGWHVIVTVPNK